MRKMTHANLRNITFVLLVIFLLSGCTNSTATPLPFDQTTPDSTFPTNEPITLPSTTPNVEKVVYIQAEQPISFDPAMISTQLEDFARSNGYQFETAQTFSPSDLQANWKVVVMIEPTLDIAGLANSTPNTRFIVITTQELTPTQNLDVIQQSSVNEAFIAGYLTTIIADDIRSVGLLASNADNAANLENAFLNGGYYYCGRCASVLGPVANFPFAISRPTDSDSNAWISAFDEMNQNRINTLYIPQAALTDTLLGYLASQNVVLVSSAKPPEEYQYLFAAIIQSDIQTDLNSILASIKDEQPGIKVTASYKLTDIQEKWLTEGKQRLVENVIAAISDGSIYPLPPFPTGE